MFSIEKLQHNYSGQSTLKFPDIHAKQSERWLLLGNSGSGKTTLLHVLGGLLNPSAGSASVAGQDLAKLSGAALDRFRGQKIGIVFQQLHLIPSLTVMQNLLVANYLAGVKQDQKYAGEILSQLGIAGKAGAFPSELSVGQQQRVAIARAVINRPEVLLADEPTAALDDQNCIRVLNLLMEQAGQCNATLFIATHDKRIRDHFKHQISLENA